MIEITASYIYAKLVEAMEASRRELSSDAIHVSEAVQCLRRSYWDRMKPAVTRDINAVLMAIGSGLHRVLQEVLESDGWIAEYRVERSIKNLFRLVGHIDLYHPEHGAVVEIKTVSAIPERPYPQHVMQLNAYLAMVRARRGFLVYVARDGRIEVFRHSFDPDYYRSVIKRAFLLWTSLRRREPPKPERGPLCEYCPYKLHCFSSSSRAREKVRK